MVTMHESITSTVDFNTGEWLYNVPAALPTAGTAVFQVNRETLKSIAGNDGTAYWAADGKVKGEAIEWKVQEAHEYGDNGKERTRYRATFERLAVALVEVAMGKHDLSTEMVQQALMMLTGQAEAYEDEEVNDCIIQVALFGKVIYG